MGLQKEETASRGQNMAPGRTPFLPPGSEDRGWAQAVAEGVVLATMVTSIFFAATSSRLRP